MPTRPPSNNPALTGIRGVAAIWVFGYHVLMMADMTGNRFEIHYSRLFYSGYLAVDLFFLLSGFILMRAHGRDFVTIDARAAGGFYRARWWRVYPLSIVVLLLIAGLFAVDRPLRAFYGSHVPGGLNLWSFAVTALLATRWGPGLPDGWNGPTWSLSIEILGYLAFPLLATLAWRVRSAALTIAVAGAALAVLLLLQAWGDHLDEGLNTFGGAFQRLTCCFTAGVFLERAAALLPSAKPAHYAAGSYASVLGIVATVYLLPRQHNVAIAFFAPLLLCLEGRAGLVFAGLSGRLGLFLGRVSFPLYLVHLMMLFALGTFAHDHGLGQRAYEVGAFVTLLLALGLATILHRAVEKPAHEVARRIGGGTPRGISPPA